MDIVIKNINPHILPKYDTIFTIGCFDYMHIGHESLLSNLVNSSNNLIVGIHDDNSLKKIKKLSNVQPYFIREKNVKIFTPYTFKILNTDPTNCIKNYIENTPKKIKIDYNYSCYIRANDNINFPAKEYIQSIMKIHYLKYCDSISTTQLRNSEVISNMNNILNNLTDILEKNNIPYFLHDKFYYNCMKYGKIFIDVPITIKAKLDKSQFKLLDKFSYEFKDNTLYINNGFSIIITITNDIPDLKKTLLLGKLYYIHNFES